jgi:hypothetical protein
VLLENAVKIGLKPKEFWGMTLKEVLMMIKAYQWRFDNQAELLAMYTTVIANAPYKKRLKPRDLYKREGQEDKVISLEERKQRFEDAKRKMGPEAIPVRKRRAT